MSTRATELFLVVLASAGMTGFVLLRSWWESRRSGSSTEPWVFGKFFSISISILFLGYGLYGLLTNDICLPNCGHFLWPGRRFTVHLHGWPVWWFFLATVCVPLYFMSAMGDKAPSDRLQLFRRVVGVFGWFFFILSLMTWLYVSIKSQV